MSAVRTTSRLAVAALGIALLLGVGAPAAGAQDDPYGSTTTTAPDDPRDGIEATCGLTLTEGRPGDTVTATVDNVFFGEKVSLFFDSIEVASTTAPPAVAGASASGPVLFGGTALPAQVPVTSVQLTFTVPPASPGTHIVTAVGDTFTCFCNPNGEFKVLAAKDGKGSLPTTGVYAALFVVVGLALVVVGRGFLAASRRRQAALDDPFVDEGLFEERETTSTRR